MKLLYWNLDYKYIVILFLLLLSNLIFSQNIPENSKILNVTYGKAKGIKDKKEKTKRKWRRYKRYDVIGLELGATTFLNKENQVPYLPSSLGISWQRKLMTHLHGSLSVNSSYVNMKHTEENIRTNYYFHNVKLSTQYHIFSSNHWFTMDSPYISAGLSLNYAPNFINQVFIGFNFGIGYHFNVTPKIDLRIEQEVNYFRLKQEKFFLSNFRLGINYTFLKF